MSLITRSKLLLLAVLMTVSLSAQAVKDGEAAPDFTLKSLAGPNLRLSELRGEVVMLNFWATWCGPCRQEMPLLEKLHQRYAKLGFKLLGVNVDEDPDAVPNFLKEHPITFPVLLDKGFKTASLYEVVAMPSTVLIDRSGKVRYIHKGYKPGDETKYADMIRTLVKEK